MSDDDAPPTVRQLLHRLDELVLGRNNHSTQDKKGDNSDTSMDSIDEDDKFDLSQLAHENDRKQQVSILLSFKHIYRLHCLFCIMFNVYIYFKLE